MRPKSASRAKLSRNTSSESDGSTVGLVAFAHLKGDESYSFLAAEDPFPRHSHNLRRVKPAPLSSMRGKDTMDREKEVEFRNKDMGYDLPGPVGGMPAKGPLDMTTIEHFPILRVPTSARFWKQSKEKILNALPKNVRLEDAMVFIVNFLCTEKERAERFFSDFGKDGHVRPTRLKSGIPPKILYNGTLFYVVLSRYYVLTGDEPPFTDFKFENQYNSKAKASKDLSNCQTEWE